eukprot:m.129141 g.129141  ORF g.129141 m.129141 type:complete len:141 (+) comp37961_c0_seq4:604-1026(+)
MNLSLLSRASPSSFSHTGRWLKQFFRCLSSRKEWREPDGIKTGLSVFNSLTWSKVPFVVPGGKPISWYQCGPTVYDHSHLGHACSYVRFDILRRIMQHQFGLQIYQVMGITDVDDKIIAKAREAETETHSLVVNRDTVFS